VSKNIYSSRGKVRETKRFPTGIRKAETALSAEENGVFQGFFAEKAPFYQFYDFQPRTAFFVVNKFERVFNFACVLYHFEQ